MALPGAEESSPTAPFRDTRPAALLLKPTDGSEPSATLPVPGAGGAGAAGRGHSMGAAETPQTHRIPTPAPKGALCRREAAARGSTTDSAGTPQKCHRPREVSPTPCPCRAPLEM